jgi:hypothetical protein
VSWTGPKELKAQMARLWERGELLRDAVSGRARFPLQLSLRSPASADLTDRFEQVRNWVQALSAARHLRIEWQEVRHRVQGAQRLPRSVWIDSLDDALMLLGKRSEWDRFAALVAMTRQERPDLLPWLHKYPMRALEASEVWPRLLAVVAWLVEHPKPRIYLRQADLPGVHSKFIEAQRGLLSELLDLTLAAEAVDVTKVGSSQFAARYGFLGKPVRIRFRLLDSGTRLIPGTVCPDITLDAESFAALTLDVKRVFITENETNFLAFPPVRDALVIFGAGYGWDALSSSQWLKRCDVHYWGDIDTHGFGILDQLRGGFDHVASLLMDKATLHAHAGMWGVEEKPLRADLDRLTTEEGELYDDLRFDRIRAGLRLEQEHIGFRWLSDRLEALLEACRRPRQTK